MELVTSDFTGPFTTSSNGNKYVLIFVDHFTKWTEVFATKDMKTTTLASCFMEFVYRHGAPSQLLTDQGRDYEAELFQQLLELLDVSKLRTSPYHPECDGLSERFNRTLIAMLRCFASQNSTNWDQLLHQLAFAYNTSTHSTTGVSPYEALYGRLPKLPIDLVQPAPTQATFYADFDEYVLAQKENFNRVYELLKASRTVNVDRFKFQHDRHVRGQSYAVGELVWLYDTTVKPGQKKKLKRYWKGPYEVVSKLGEVNYYIRLAHSAGKRLRKQLVHFNRLKRCIFDPVVIASTVVASPASSPADQELNSGLVTTRTNRRRQHGVQYLPESSPISARSPSVLDLSGPSQPAPSPSVVQVTQADHEPTARTPALSTDEEVDLVGDQSVHSEFGYQARTRIAEELAPARKKRGRPRTRFVFVTPRVQPARTCKRLVR